MGDLTRADAAVLFVCSVILGALGPMLLDAWRDR